MVSGYDQPASPKHITHNMDKATMQSELVDNLAKWTDLIAYPSNNTKIEAAPNYF